MQKLKFLKLKGLSGFRDESVSVVNTIRSGKNFHTTL